MVRLRTSQAAPRLLADDLETMAFGRVKMPEVRQDLCAIWERYRGLGHPAASAGGL